MAVSKQTTLTDQDIAQLDKPLSDMDVTMFDAGQEAGRALPPKPVDPPQLQIQQQFQAKRQSLDKMYQGMAKANKIASYGVPAGVLTDQQAARYNQEIAKLASQEQAALAAVPPPPPPGPPPIPAADGLAVTQGDLKEGTFGDAYERRTKTPIRFEGLPQFTEGQYQDPGWNAMTYLPAFHGLNTKQGRDVFSKGLIQVDPSHTNSPSRVIRHEALHQILDKNEPITSSASEQSALYPQIKRSLSVGRPSEDWPQEVPAHMGAYTPSESDVTPDQRQLYINDFIKNLTNTAPTIANQYSAIANLPPQPLARGGAVGHLPKPYARNGKSLAGPQTVLAGEAGNELLIHHDGSQELLDHPQLRQLGTQGTDQVLPLTRPEGPKEVLRGTSNIPLDEQGQQEAALNGKRYANQFDNIMVGPLLRTQQTGQHLQQSNPQAQFQLSDAFKDMGLGQLEGQQVTIPAIEQINHMVLREPDMPFQGQGPLSTGPGDSFRGFKDRIIGGLTRLMASHAANPGLRSAVVTHNRVLRVVKGWEENGFAPDGKINTDPLVHYHKGASPPGAVEHLAQDAATGRWKLNAINGEPQKGPDGKVAPGIYLFRHGRTAWNSPGKSG